MINRLGIFAVFTATLFIGACAGKNVNSTVYDYQYEKKLIKNNTDTVMIAPVNFGKPSRHYIKKHEEGIDALMKGYLKDNGFKVTSNRPFSSFWKKAQSYYGDTFNPSTGLLTKAHKPAMLKAIDDSFAANPKLDLIIFTDIIETDVQYSNKLVAQWHGIKRKLKTEGTGDGVGVDFNWAVTLDGLSIRLFAINRDQKVVLHNIGGIQVAQALVLKNSNGRFKRRNDLLKKDKDILEAIHLALHPLIIMENYPSKTEE